MKTKPFIFGFCFFITFLALGYFFFNPPQMKNPIEPQLETFQTFSKESLTDTSNVEHTLEDIQLTSKEPLVTKKGSFYLKLNTARTTLGYFSERFSKYLPVLNNNNWLTFIRSFLYDFIDNRSISASNLNIRHPLFNSFKNEIIKITNLENILVIF